MSICEERMTSIKDERGIWFILEAFRLMRKTNGKRWGAINWIM